MLLDKQGIRWYKIRGCQQFGTRWYKDDYEYVARQEFTWDGNPVHEGKLRVTRTHLTSVMGEMTPEEAAEL